MSEEKVEVTEREEVEKVEDVEEEEKSNVVPASATKGGRETSDKVLYVGNLDKSITEDLLKQYFQAGGPIQNVKIIVDNKNNYVNYAFVEYVRAHDANVALQTLNGVQLENKTLKINRAFQTQQAGENDENFNLFVGDLNIDVDDETLASQFRDFPSFIQAHVMWDMQTGRSRGYGFVSFSSEEEAQRAMETMQGKELSGRQVRINWATKRERNSGFNNNNNNYRGGHNGFRPYGNNRNNRNMMPPAMGMPMDGMMPMQQAQQNGQQVNNQQQQPMVPPPVNPQAIEDMIRRAPARITTAYIGNIQHFATEADLIPLLQNFGFILDFTYYPEKGHCFIKYDTHEQAAVCIVALANFPFQGRNLKTGWGKERTNFMPPQGGPGQQMPVMMDPSQGPGPQ
ncbi:Nuclear and cytoplasmic polyadenylated RNA-binding protein PUB1 [Nakaseomyces bracarensis]|uniref:Nuclear and cytoplasmic polyadenylated RNA-binding protein PUB1 n=1 Tax=Nakaseomyces bracarensis TaxID=273131 RepID=A0ABR4NMA9_9SACH